MEEIGTGFNYSLGKVIGARHEAIIRHGELKAGPIRWMRLIEEEYREVVDELALLHLLLPESVAYSAARAAAIEELAQLAQLCMGVIELIHEGRIKEEV